MTDVASPDRQQFLLDVEAMFAASVMPSGHFAAAELDAEGVVVIRDESGNPTAWMSPEAFAGFEQAGVEIRNKEHVAQLVADMKKLAAPRSLLNRHDRRAEAARRRRGRP